MALTLESRCSDRGDRLIAHKFGSQWDYANANEDHSELRRGDRLRPIKGNTSQFPATAIPISHCGRHYRG